LFFCFFKISIDPTFGGLLDAMNNMLHSAWANYVSFGSDTGGYRCCGSVNKVQGRTREVLLRWAQLNSLMGLFENVRERKCICNLKLILFV
jgi:hypothetical protein